MIKTFADYIFSIIIKNSNHYQKDGLFL